MNVLRAYNEAWADFELAFQELSDALLPKKQWKIRYWVCLQTPSEHFFDYDDPRIAMVPTRNWRTHGKQLCPQCASILEERMA